MLNSPRKQLLPKPAWHFEKKVQNNRKIRYNLLQAPYKKWKNVSGIEKNLKFPKEAQISMVFLKFTS